MLKPVRGEDQQPTEPKRPRRQRLRTIAMLPTLLTLGNLYFGFAAAYYCGREMQDLGAGREASEVETLKSAFFEARAPSFLSIAVWMLMAGMICDALDGRVARKTGRSSKFGEQLDSLADIVSFGLAPALLMVTLTQRELSQWGYAPFGFEEFGRVAVFIGAIYVCCAGLRLARFTVEATVEEASHHGFRGLPSPGAAGAVASLVFLHDQLDVPGGWPATAAVIAKILPACTLMIALLMVSSIPYAHAVSSFLRRRPFGHVVPVLLVIPLLLRYTEQVLAIAAWSFIASGLVRFAWRKIKAKPVRAESQVRESPESAHPDSEVGRQVL